MKNILILINRNFLIFFKKINMNLFLYFLFPVFVYLFIVSPFSNLFDFIISSSMSYTYHSVPAVIFTCTSMLAFLIPLTTINRDSKNHFLHYMFTTKVTSNHYFLSVLIYSLICSYIEYIISFFIAVQLSDAGSNLGFIISWNQIFSFSIIIFPSILFFSSLGLFLSNFLKRIEHILISLIFIFLLISFGSASFIPIDYYPSSYGSFIKDYNIIFQLFSMCISIVEDNKIILGTFIIAVFLSIIFYVFNLILSKKRGNIY